ncbi:hypothetical protein [Microtetraspora niveoalba]|uniref:hypothetical protein n=1 Tax=Microtetraspora niveoalba TaxID=46175 RepID=UPI001471BD1F|nr:hypothetical protein [Microtetraspora niveoalba]
MSGIHFAARGRVWFKYGGPDCTLSSARAARAAALTEIYRMATGHTACCPPGKAFEAEQALALDLASWQEAEQHRGLRIRARVTLALTGEDAERATAFDEEVRAAQLDQAVAADRLAHLSSTALADMQSARIWWFDQHLRRGHLLDSWDSFDAVVRPLVSENTDDAATRFAQVFATAAQRIIDHPDKAHDLRLAAHVLLTRVGWPDLADNLPGDSSVRSDNGAGQST